MRLREIKNIINHIDTESSFLIFEINDKNSYMVKNITLFKKFIDKVRNLAFFQHEIDDIIKYDIYTTSLSYILLTVDKVHLLRTTSNYLIHAVESLGRALESILPEEKEYTINIKLPCPNDIENLLSDLKSFEKCINQVICNNKINGSLNINSWESGSFWVELLVGSQAAVALVAGISWSAAVVSKKMKEGKILEQHIRSLEIKNESLEDILDKQKKATDLLIEQEVRSLQVRHFDSDTNNEQFERLKLTTKTFAELIQKGAEVHPALSAPEQVQNVFPDYKNIETITSKIKLLENSTVEEQ